MQKRNGEAEFLDAAIDRYAPDVAATARAALKKRRKRDNQVRSIRLDPAAEVLDDPYIRGLMAQTVNEARVDLKNGRGAVVLESKIGQ